MAPLPSRLARGGGGVREDAHRQVLLVHRLADFGEPRPDRLALPFGEGGQAAAEARSSAVDSAVHTATASKPRSGRPSARLTVRAIMFGLRRAAISRNQESNGRQVKIENRAMKSWNAPSHRRPPT